MVERPGVIIYYPDGRLPLYMATAQLLQEVVPRGIQMVSAYSSLGLEGRLALGFLGF